VGFHSQCGIDPPRYAVWLSKANRTYRVGVFADVFAVHLLGRGDAALGDLFGAATGDDIDKFARCRWTAGPDGVPLLDDLPDRIVGRRRSLVDAGADHVCFVLEPIEVDERPGGPSGPWLRVSDLAGDEPGHDADERHPPA
jgi:flavin reductase (DIM6/NTAB) family NADH-FMN oxidoreductase RutF